MKKKRKLKKYAVSLSYSAAFSFKDTPYTPLRATRKYKGKEIAEFGNHIVALYTLALFLSLSSWRIFAGKTSGHPKSVRERIRDIEPLRYSEILVPTLHLCVDEFVAFLSELQTAAYSGAARTLRYTLELATAACEFQTDPHRLTLEDVVGICAKKNWIEFMMNNNAWSAFIERSRLYEDTKRIAPTFKELVNRLASRGIFEENPQMAIDIRKAYEFLSDHVHPSTARIENQLAGKERRPIEYDPDQFKVIYDIGIKILDMVTCLFIESGSRYRNSPDAKEFVREMSAGMMLDAKLEETFLKLPYSAEFSRDLKWSFAAPGRRARSGLRIKVTPVKTTSGDAVSR
jgi:hypothetical protein